MNPAGQDAWPGECTTGKSQSPIDIPIANNVRAAANIKPFVFENYDKTPKVEIVKNIGLSVQMTVLPAKPKWHPKVRHTNRQLNEWAEIQTDRLVDNLNFKLTNRRTEW